MKRSTRRGFLGAAALGAAGVPLLGRYERFLGGQRASAQPPEIPKRLVIFWNPQGNCSGLDTDYAPHGLDPLWPTGNGRDFHLGYDPAAPTPGRILAPLARHRDDLLLMRGFNLPTGQYTVTPCGTEVPDGAHGFGSMCGLTAACPAEGGDLGGDISVDQLVARHIGEDTPRPSMVLTCGGTSRNRRGYISYNGPGDPVPPMDAEMAYRSAFGESVGADQARMAELRAPDEEAPWTSSAPTRRAFGGDSRRRSGTRWTRTCNALRLLERDFDRDLLCESDPFTDPGNHFPGHYQRQARTVAAAIACDVSRVYSIMGASGGGDSSGDLRYFDPDWVPNYHSTGHASGGNSDEGNVGADRRHAYEMMIRVSEFYANWVAELIDALKAIPEGGGTAFDNTVILWATEMSHGNHGNHQWPWIVAGGGWKFTQGYYWNQPSDSPYATDFMYGDLLTAVAQAMGVPIERFGNDAFSKNDPSLYSHLWTPGV